MSKEGAMENSDARRAPAPEGGDSLDGIVLPTAYRINAEKALARYPRQAANYLKHTLVGDPLLDGMPQELADMPRSEVTRFIQAGIDQDLDVMRHAPKVLRDFFVDYPPPDPPWLDYEAFKPGVRKFQKDSGLILRVRGRRAGRRLRDAHQQIVRSHGPRVRTRREASSAEQPPLCGYLLPRRVGKAG